MAPSREIYQMRLRRVYVRRRSRGGASQEMYQSGGAEDTYGSGLGVADIMGRGRGALPGDVRTGCDGRR